MRNILIASTFIFLSLLGTSCKRENTYLVEGVVVNRITQEPLEGVKMTLNDGLGVGGIFPSDEIEVSNVTYTDEQGKFKIQIKSKSNHAVLWLSKQGYEFQIQESTSDTRFYGINDEYTSVKLEMDGIAYFNSPFYKTSAPQKDQDSLKITLLSYEDLNKLYLLDPRLYNGKGVFHYPTLNYPFKVKGDRYLRYKLEFTTDGVWQTKIDSVFLPTSLEVFRDTIYY